MARETRGERQVKKGRVVTDVVPAAVVVRVLLLLLSSVPRL